MAEYWAVKCVNCGRWTGKICNEGRKIQDLRFKCNYCNVGGKVKREGAFGLRNETEGPFKTPQQLARVVAYLNDKRKV